MQLILKIWLTIMLLISWQTSGLSQEKCGTNEAWERILRENPEIKKDLEIIENDAALYDEQLGTSTPQEITIPVVVHIVWTTEAENISDAQVQAQIDVINQDFRRLNADAVLTPMVWQPIAVDCKINFCLAKRTPSGQPTTGIERRHTIVPQFGLDNAVKFNASGGLDAWDRNRYLNLWVCKLEDGLLGYAQFPGGPAATDGVVIHAPSFGYENGEPPYNLGRTTTHEIGHWLNLRHIWGDDNGSCLGTDFVFDTPNQAAKTEGCPTFPTVSCLNGPHGDMFMNYMDYTDDACMNLFTLRQRTRMHSVLTPSGKRGILRQSDGCVQPAPTCLHPDNLYADPVEATTALLNWQDDPLALSYTLQWKVAGSSTWNTVNGIVANQYLLSGLIAGTSYEFRVSSNCQNGNSDYSPGSMFTTDSNAPCVENYEPNNTLSTAVVIPVNAEIQAQISTNNDKDWYKFANSDGAPNIKVDLTDLPADYDLKLYRGSVLLGVSQNTGLVSEQIIRNTSTVSDNYYVYVSGYSGASSNTDCYSLRVSLSGEPWEETSLNGSADDRSSTIKSETPFFHITPNPASDQVVLTVNTGAEELITATLMSTTGMVISSQRVWAKGHQQLVFDVSQVQEGIYLVQVKSASMQDIQKVVVKH